MPETKYRVEVISAFSEKSGYSGSVPLDAFTEFITGPHDDKSDTLINVDKAYRCVPYYHRSINIRAGDVARVPWHFEDYQGNDVTDQYEYLKMLMRTLTIKTIKSLVKRGVAYWLIESNRVGKNQTPRYIPAQSVRVLTDEQQGIIGYEITWSSGVRRYPLDQMVRFIFENDDSEIAPDVPPAVVTLEAAGLLYASNAVPSRFYAGGFVPVSLVTFPVQTQKADIDKTENFFKRMATGFKKMFSVLGVYEGVDVKTVGHTLKDSITPEITEAAREDVTVGLGVPPTRLSANSANYATATVDQVGYYLDTIFTDCDLLSDTANMQFFSRLGLKWVHDIKKHEIWQTIQLAQAASVQMLTPKPPLTVDEGRAILDYPPMSEIDKAEQEADAIDETEDVQEVEEEEAAHTKKALTAWQIDTQGLMDIINAARTELKAAMSTPAPQPVSLSFDVKSPDVTITHTGQPPAQVTVVNQVEPTPIEYRAGDTIVQPTPIEYRAGDVVVQPAPVANEIIINPTPITNEIKAGDVHIDVQPAALEYKAGDIIVQPTPITNEINVQPAEVVVQNAGDVIVQPAAVNVAVEPTPITNEITVQPAPVETTKHISVDFKRSKNASGLITSADAEVTNG
jgi:hypothetical protein